MSGSRRGLTALPPPRGREDITGARVLGFYEDKITTDHISPAGSIAVDSPAGKYLLDHEVRDGQVQHLWCAEREPRGHGEGRVRET